MSNIANLINTTGFSDMLKRFDFNISATVTGGADSPEYSMDIYPFTKGMINTAYIKCASTTYTISLFDVSGGIPIFKESAINGEHLENNVGAPFYTTLSSLFCVLNNIDTGNATGVITISVVIQGQQ